MGELDAGRGALAGDEARDARERLAVAVAPDPEIGR